VAEEKHATCELNLASAARGIKHLSMWFNPFQSNFSANRILPSSYLFWAVKRLVDYLELPYSFNEKNMEKQKEYNLRYLLAKVRTT
jgi:hypothetical protein